MPPSQPNAAEEHRLARLQHKVAVPRFSSTSHFLAINSIRSLMNISIYRLYQVPLFNADGRQLTENMRLKPQTPRNARTILDPRDMERE